MLLGAVTHFEQGWSLNWYDEAVAVASAAYRDGISWSKIETSKGVYDFDHASLDWIRRLTADQAEITLLFGRLSNPLYDNGNTVYTEAGRQAFADFVVATLRAFPGIQRIEIGNELNSNNFVTGPFKDDFSARDEAYAALLATLDGKLDAAGIDVDIIGGAAHSIPADWFSLLKTAGAFEHMDGVAIHPYTTPPEQFEEQIVVLRQAMGNSQLPIHVTEFGQAFDNLDDAAPYLAKMVSVMAAAGVDQAQWYAFAKQKWFPNMELYDWTSDTLTPAGKTFAFLEQLLAGGPVSKVALDDFTYIYTFGDKAAVVWGEARSLSLADGVAAYDLFGNRIGQFGGAISPDEPIVLISDSPLKLQESFTFGASSLVGDSYHQFDGTNPTTNSAAGFEGPWSYYSLTGTGKLAALQTMGGGGRTNEPWTPYIGSPWLRPLMVTAEAVNPIDFGNGTKPAQSYSTVERFTAATSQTVGIIGHWDVKDTSVDGITLTIKHNTTVLEHRVVFNPANGHVLDLKLDGIKLSSGDTLEFIVGPNGNSKGGDVTSRLVRIVDQTTSSAQTGLKAPSPDTGQAAEASDGSEDPLTGGSGGSSDPVVDVPTAPIVDTPPAPANEVPAAPIDDVPTAPAVDEPVAPVIGVPAAPVSYDWRLFASHGFLGEAGGTGVVFGSEGTQTISVLDLPGTIDFDGSFNKGGDRILLAGEAADWHVMRSGSRVLLTDGDTAVSIPVGRAGTSIEFGDGPRTLIFDGQILLGNQVVGDSLAPVTSAPEAPLAAAHSDGSAEGRLFLAQGGSAVVGGTLDVFGTRAAEELVLTYGEISLDPSFNAGADVIALDGPASDFGVRLVGSVAMFRGAGIEMSLPVGTTGTTLSFSDGERTLLYDLALQSATIGGQEFGAIEMPLTFA